MLRNGWHTLWYDSICRWQVVTSATSNIGCFWEFFLYYWVTIQNGTSTMKISIWSHEHSRAHATILVTFALLKKARCEEMIDIMASILQWWFWGLRNWLDIHIQEKSVFIDGIWLTREIVTICWGLGLVLCCTIWTMMTYIALANFVMHLVLPHRFHRPQLGDRPF